VKPEALIPLDRAPGASPLGTLGSSGIAPMVQVYIGTEQIMPSMIRVAQQRKTRNGTTGLA
jgi:hypothetical protein